MSELIFLEEFILNNYLIRLATFEKWKYRDIICPRELAWAGFYFYEGDRVICQECHIICHKWEVGDIALNEHQKWGPNCLHVKIFMNLDEYKISDDKIIEVWKKSCIVRQFSTLKLYSESEIEAGLRKRLDSHFKNFATYKEIHDFFRDLYPTVQVADTGDYNPLICRICWTNPTKIIFLDCGHACACVGCANDLKECPLCRSLIKKFQTIFFQ